MKVSRMIKELQKCDPDAEVKMHHHADVNALFVLELQSIPGVVIIEDKSDSDLRSELSARYKNAVEQQIDELNFYMDLFETGFTLEDIKENIPEHYESAKMFCEEHGLV